MESEQQVERRQSQDEGVCAAQNSRFSHQINAGTDIAADLHPVYSEASRLVIQSIRVRAEKLPWSHARVQRR